MKNSKKNLALQYLLAGTCFGLLFPVLATVAKIYSEGMEWTLEVVLALHQSELLLMIIDSAPVVLGLLFFIIGLKQLRVIEINEAYQGSILNRNDLLREQNRKLSEENAERKKAEELLIKAKADAEHASKMRADFLSTMSHEIRTPLNAIIGLTGLLQETRLDQEQADYLDTIHMSGDALLAIINDILDYSKIEAGKMEMENEPMTIWHPVEDAFDIVGAKANAKNIDLIYDIAENVPVRIKGDITRIRQILINLVGNAIKFTEKGEIIVRVRETGEEKDKRTLEFSVQDTGIGIPPDGINKLFEAFSQVDTSTTRKYGGTGLGLMISQKLTHLMGGRIWVESKPGIGSTFFFTVQTEVAEGDECPNRGYLKNIRGREVLIVDDNPTNLEILSKRLKKWGLIVKVAAEPQYAWKLLKNGYDPDICILDYHMPVMGGIELAEKILTEKGRDYPLIMLSSEGGPKNQEEKALFKSWLTKPVRKEQLFRAIVCSISTEKILEDAKKKAQPQKTSFSDLKVLIAEDNIINQKVAIRQLEKFGCEIKIANHGKEALDIVQDEYFDIVFMDMQMPLMDGITATRGIRALESEFADTVIIAMTANATFEDRDRCLDAGMNDFLSKPVNGNDLEAILKKWRKASVA